MSTLLPLFPLDLVLLPGSPLPLHIFEPRYKEMIAECQERNKPFGVVRAKDEKVAEIGCTAEIVGVVKKYPDGKLDIVTQGRERFAVVQMNRERSFPQAEVLYLEDKAGSPTDGEVAAAMKLHDEVMALAGAVPEQTSEIEGSHLAFHIAGSLPLDLDFKQALLEMESERERVQAIIAYFETFLPNLRRTVHMRKKAGGNGHG